MWWNGINPWKIPITKNEVKKNKNQRLISIFINVTINRNLGLKEALGSDSFTGEFYKTYRKEIFWPYKLTQKTEEEAKLILF